MLGLNWRQDGSEGVAWHLRAICDDGAFYGEIRFQSQDFNRCRSTFVIGKLTSEECGKLASLTPVIRRQTPHTKPFPHFALLWEGSPDHTGDIHPLLWYRVGDEVDSEPARAFLELVGLLERHLQLFYPQITGPLFYPESWANTEQHLQGLPGSAAICERVRAGAAPWLEIAGAMTHCDWFPASAFGAVLASGDFDVRWPLTFAAWYWGETGSSVDEACADFLSTADLWQRAIEVLPEYDNHEREWLSGWRRQFEQFRRPTQFGGANRC